MEASDFARIYDTILSIPGMGDTVKIDLRISRKNVLVLSSIIERGLGAKFSEKEGGLLSNVPKETFDELKVISDECLEKAGLIELSQKLGNLSVSKPSSS